MSFFSIFVLNIKTMKKIALLLLFIPSLLFSQFQMEDAAYKASLLRIYNGDKLQRIEESSVLFYFDKGIMTSSKRDQTKLMRFETQERKTMNYKGGSLPILKAQAKDSGGFLCAFIAGWVEETDTYIIFLGYDDVQFFYECQLTDERPWDNDPPEFQPHEPMERNYTDEEVDEFLRMFGDPKVLKRMMWNSLFLIL